MDFFPDTSNIDLREELHGLLHGRVDMVPQGRPMLLRRLTNDHCVCWDGIEGGPRQMCPYCQGEGYYWRETLETFFVARGAAPIYKTGVLASAQYPQAAYGYDDPNKGTGFCEYSVFPDYERYTWPQHKSFDKLYELKLNEDGSLHYPLVPTIKWKCLTVVPIHGDFGRVEYIVLDLLKENVQ